ncbi:MAG: DUF2207 domain-containing protein [Bacilli bacterium]|nr:DUF2207 domain-containing protein [Bacilli bacterium]
MKRYIWLFTILLLFPFVNVNANTVSSINMDIYLDNDGTAHVTETWIASVNQGTEGYHPYYNLGEARLTNLHVSMDGQDFDTVSWDVNRSFSDKAYKAGIYYAGDGEYDLCFGITNYGTHTYVMKYKIEGFVVKLADADMVYWNLFPKNFSAAPNDVSIKIHSDFQYEDTLDVWGYGKYGAPCYVANGVIEMTSDNEPVSDSEYMTILVKFPKDTFNSYHKLDNEFEYYRKLADDGATNYKGNKGNYNKIGIVDFLISILGILFEFIPYILIFLFSLIFAKKKIKKYDFGETGNKIRSDVPNFREIPCNKDIYRAYWVSDAYNLNKKKEDFLGTVLLKWLRHGNVRVEKVETKKLFGKNNVDDNIIFEHEPDDSIELEKNLYRWMYEASKDGKLEKDEFKSWCKSHYSKILKWFDDILLFETKMLVNENKVESITSGNVFKSTKYKISSDMMKEAEQMAGLKNFLKEFSLIKEREPIEVKLWDEYLMFAQIFGIADEVASQFKKLYPEVIQDMDKYGFDYSDIVFMHSISSDGIRSASAAQRAAQSYSSGGGGFSSGGGGGGSFGGGGGGGGFR